MSPATCQEGLGLTGDTPSCGYTARIAPRESAAHPNDSNTAGSASSKSFALLINRSREVGGESLSTERTPENRSSEDERESHTVRAGEIALAIHLRPEFVVAALAADFISAINASVHTARPATTPPASRPAATPPSLVASPNVEPAEVRIRSHGPDQGQAEILLRHPQLGRVQLVLTLTHGELDVVATVTRPQAAESIARSEGELRLSLAAQGIELKTLRIKTVDKKKKAAEPTRSRQGRAFPKEDKS